MKQLLLIAVTALLLATPAAARAEDARGKMMAADAPVKTMAEDDPVKMMQEIDKLSTAQLGLVDKFKENAAEAAANKKRFAQLNKDDLREKKEHITLDEQRAEVKKLCVGVVQPGTLIEAENACNALKAPFEENVEIHNQAIARTAQEFKVAQDKEIKRNAEATKLLALDADQKAQLFALKRKVLIAIKSIWIPGCAQQAPNRMNSCIEGAWERARRERKLPHMPGEKPEPPETTPAPAEDTGAPAAPPAPPPVNDPGDPLAGAPKQTTQ